MQVGCSAWWDRAAQRDLRQAGGVPQRAGRAEVAEAEGGEGEVALHIDLLALLHKFLSRQGPETGGAVVSATGVHGRVLKVGGRGRCSGISRSY